MFKLAYAVSGIPDNLIDDINAFNVSEISELIQFHEENLYLKQDFKILTECSDTIVDEPTTYLY